MVNSGMATQEGILPMRVSLILVLHPLQQINLILKCGRGTTAVTDTITMILHPILGYAVSLQAHRTKLQLRYLMQTDSLGIEMTFWQADSRQVGMTELVNS